MLWIVVALSFQEKAADALKRDGWRAVEAFVEQGEPAREPLQEAAKSGDRDVAFYAAAALAEIDSLDEFKVVPRTKAMEGRAPDIAAELFKSAGLESSVKGIEDKKVSLPAGLSFAEAVDRLSRELDVELIGGEREKNYMKVPRFASGRVCARLESWRRHTFQRPGSPAVLTLSMGGSIHGLGPFRAPLLEGRLRVIEALDDQGKSVRVDDGSLVTPESQERMGHFRLSISDTSRLSRLRLAADFRLEKKRGDVSFEKILEARNVKKTVGDVTITVRRVDGEDGGYRIEFTVVGLPDRANLKEEDVRLLDTEDRAWKSSGWGAGFGGGEGSYDASFRAADAGAPAKLVLTMLTETATRSVYFEFRDVEMK